MEGERRSAGPIAACLFSAALFGASTPASKALLGDTGPLVLSGILYAGAALAVAPWASSGPARATSAARGDWLRLAGAVVFGGVIGPVLMLLALARAPAGSVALWMNLETVATALLARFFFREHLQVQTSLAMGLIIGASAMLAPITTNGGPSVVLVALACLAWGLDNNLTAVLDRFTPAQVVFAKGAVAGVVNLGIGLAFADRAPPVGSVVLGLAVGAVSYGASLILYVAGAQHLGAMRSQLLFSTAPAWGLLLAWLFLGEDVTAGQVGALLVMAIAIALLRSERHVHEHTHAAVTHTHWHRHDDGHHAHAHDGPSPAGWHSHEHTHDARTHSHPHRPDLHHRHDHGGAGSSGGS